MKYKLFRFGPVILWMYLMFFLSSRTDLPSGETLQSDFLLKKMAHVFEYFVLNGLWFFALGKNRAGQAILFSLIFAFTDEIHQLFIPGRTGKLRDVGIDFLGILASSILINNLLTWKNFLFPALLKKHKR